MRDKGNKVAPGGLSHDPRAAKRRNFKDKSAARFSLGIGLSLLLLLSGAVIYSGLRSQPRPLAEAERPLPTPVVSIPVPVAATTIQPNAPPIDPPAPAPAPLPRDQVSGIYRYVDAQGGIHFADQLDKVPVADRQAVQFTPQGTGESSAFRVQIVGNHVLVPVTLHNGGNTVTALLLLDTGCTVTTISEELANRLKIDSLATRTGMTRVADGRMIATRRARIDQMMVGSRAQPAAEVSIMANSGAADQYDGLLGMSFLRQHRYQVDYDNGLIRWQ